MFMFLEMYVKYLLIFNLLAFISADAKFSELEQLFYFDEFQPCIDSGGTYCLTYLKLSPSNETNPSESWIHIQKISKPDHKYAYELPAHGICTNNNETIADIARNRLDGFYSKFGLQYEIRKSYCEGRNDKFHPALYDYTIAIIAIGYILFVLYASLFGPNTPVVKCFSLKDNFRSLTTTTYRDADMKALRGIQGLRMLALVSVTFVHYKSALLSLPGAHPGKVEESVLNSAKLRLFSTGAAGMSTFFAMSTFLVTYYTFKYLDEHKNASVTKFFLLGVVNRYLRVLPLIVAVLSFQSSMWFRNLSTGIYWGKMITEEYWKCKSDWLTTLTFNKAVFPHTDKCMSQTWSMDYEIKSYIVVLLVVCLIRNRKYLVYPISAVLLFIYGYVKFTTLYQNHWRHAYYASTKEIFDYNVTSVVNYHWIHVNMLPHLPGVVSGFLTGYLYYRYKNTKIFTKKIYVDIWRYIINYINISNILIGTLLNPKYHFLEAAYGVLDGLTMPIAFLVGTMGVTQGLKAWVNIFEHPVAQVIGRLSFGCFLSHILLIRLYVGSMRTPVNMSASQDLAAIPLFLVVFTTAALLTVFIEMPFGKLAKVLLRGPGQKKEKIKQN